MSLYAQRDYSTARNGSESIQSHIDFTANDVLFFFELIDGEARLKYHLGEHFEECLGAFGRAIDVIHGAVECRISIPLAAGCLHGIGDGFSIVACRAFEDHVLEHVREAGAEEVALVDTACFHPCLCADDRGIRVGIKDNGEAVFQGVHTGSGSGKLHGGKVGEGFPSGDAVGGLGKAPRHRPAGSKPRA